MDWKVKSTSEQKWNWSTSNGSALLPPSNAPPSTKNTKLSNKSINKINLKKSLILYESYSYNSYSNNSLIQCKIQKFFSEIFQKFSIKKRQKWVGRNLVPRWRVNSNWLYYTVPSNASQTLHSLYVLFGMHSKSMRFHAAYCICLSQTVFLNFLYKSFRKISVVWI